MSVVTGYTAGILTGKYKSLKDYIMACSQAFIGDIDMDDIDQIYDNEIKYHEEQLKEVSKEYKNFLKTIKNNKEDFALRGLKQKRDDILERLNNQVGEKQLFEEMLTKVEKWNASSNFTNLKTFACNQINQCLDHYDLTYEKRELANIQEILDNPPIQIIEKCIKQEEDNYKWKIDYYTSELNDYKKKKKEILEWYYNLKDELEKISN